MRNPPVLVAVLGFFGALAGFGFLFMGFRMLGFDWFGLFGDLPRFESVGLWGWLAIAAGILWLAASLGIPLPGLGDGRPDWRVGAVAWLVCMVGLAAERWLFFAEARHTVRLYHGDKRT